ncbi:RCC1 domain-containing protein [Polyangium sorediatum]|uniref:Uncharacterized protein n=1 Tax=Polyangium sorediatum TaxID=889274 RepID=A0ABT6NTZ8_9BACT|nr:hypothetical protein [Polyangium sorediatum]MDI1431805.1 hypothetical protein [Polyangium sorediatum]
MGLPEPATAVSAGGVHTCAILASKRVVCWGMNDYQPHLREGSSVPRVIEGLAGVEELALGAEHTCARLTTGEVRCWGEAVKPFGPRPIAGLCAKQLTAGDEFTCALSCNDEVLCWGWRDVAHRSHWLEHPTLVPSLPADIVEVRAGGSGGHVCIRDGKGRLSCWGSNESGQLGEDGPKRRPEPSAPSVRGAEARRVCAGGAVTLGDVKEDGERADGHSGTTCTLSTSGEVRCWGEAMETYRPTLVDLPRGTK